MKGHSYIRPMDSSKAFWLLRQRLNSAICDRTSNAKASVCERVSIASTIECQLTLQLRLDESANASSNFIQRTDTFSFRASFKDDPSLSIMKKMNETATAKYLRKHFSFWFLVFICVFPLSKAFIQGFIPTAKRIWKPIWTKIIHIQAQFHLWDQGFMIRQRCIELNAQK